MGALGHTCLLAPATGCARAGVATLHAQVPAEKDLPAPLLAFEVSEAVVEGLGLLKGASAQGEALRGLCIVGLSCAVRNGSSGMAMVTRAGTVKVMSTRTRPISLLQHLPSGV